MNQRKYPIIRIFISSTFEDMSEERNILQKTVFKELDRYCVRHNWRLQVVDLRWGVSDKDCMSQQTLNICLKEIEKSKNLSPSPYFLILSSSRYGWKPIPYSLSIDTANSCLEGMYSSSDSEELTSLFHRWYYLDDTQLPYPDYKLNELKGKDDLKQFQIDERKLQLFFSNWSKTNTNRDFVKLERSATEQEIHIGALSYDHPEDFSCCVIVKNDKYESDDGESVENLHRTLRAAFTNNIIEIDKDSEQYNECFYSNVLDRLQSMISNEVERTLMPVVAEENQTIVYMQHLTRAFRGRKTEEQTINNYLCDSDTCSPLIVIGDKGAGKSTILSNVILGLLNNNAENVIFLLTGITPNTNIEYEFLNTLYCQIIKFAGYIKKEFETTNDLIIEIKTILENTPIELHIFIDAIDQLEKSHSFDLFNWIPSVLNNKCKIVISCTSDFYANNIEHNHTNYETLSLNNLCDNDIHCIVMNNLQLNNKTLNSDNYNRIWGSCNITERTPLYLSLSTQQLQNSHSLNLIGKSTKDIVVDLLDELSATFGYEYIKTIFSGINNTLYGLCETDIITLINLSDRVHQEFLDDSYYDYECGFEERIPQTLWYRCIEKLSLIIEERCSLSSLVLNYKHSIIKDIVKDYYSDTESEYILGLLATVFYKNINNGVNDPYTIVEYINNLILRQEWDLLAHKLVDISFLDSILKPQIKLKMQDAFERTITALENKYLSIQHLTPDTYVRILDKFQSDLIIDNPNIILCLNDYYTQIFKNPDLNDVYSVNGLLENIDKLVPGFLRYSIKAYAANNNISYSEKAQYLYCQHNANDKFIRHQYEDNVICSRVNLQKDILIEMLDSGDVTISNISGDINDYKYKTLNILNLTNSNRLLEVNIDSSCSFIIFSTEQGLYYFDIKFCSTKLILKCNSDNNYHHWKDVSITADGKYVLFISTYSNINILRTDTFEICKFKRYESNNAMHRNDRYIFSSDGVFVFLVRDSGVILYVNWQNEKCNWKKPQEGITQDCNSVSMYNLTNEERFDGKTFTNYIYEKEFNVFSDLNINFQVYRALMKEFSCSLLNEHKGENRNIFMLSEDDSFLIGVNAANSMTMYNLLNGESTLINSRHSDLLTYSKKGLVLFQRNGLIRQPYSSFNTLLDFLPTATDSYTGTGEDQYIITKTDVENNLFTLTIKTKESNDHAFTIEIVEKRHKYASNNERSDSLKFKIHNKLTNKRNNIMLEDTPTSIDAYISKDTSFIVVVTDSHVYKILRDGEIINTILLESLDSYYDCINDYLYILSRDIIIRYNLLTFEEDSRVYTNIKGSALSISVDKKNISIVSSSPVWILIEKYFGRRQFN